MNEILKKRIEVAADDFSRNESPYYYQAFIDGAEYALSHQFISVDEALPKYDETVIVAWYNGDYSFNHRSNDPAVKIDGNGFCDYGCSEVVAWMPLPEFKTKEE